MIKVELETNSFIASNKKKFLELFFIFLFYNIVIFIFYPGIFLKFSSINVRGDLTNILSIISFSINTPLEQIYHLPFFYPESYILAKTHPLFGISIFFKIFKTLGFTIFESTNLYYLFSFISGAFGTFLLSKEFTKNRFFPLLLSAAYIMYPNNYIHLVWLNFLSNFYIPFIFLFLIKYLKTKKKYYAILVAILSVFQFLASIYYGVLLWAFLIPVFLLFSLLLKIIFIKDIKFIIICLILGFFIIGAVFYPFLSQNEPAMRKFDNRLTTPAQIFSYSKILTFFIDIPTQREIFGYFPGFLLIFFVLLYLYHYIPKNKILFLSILLFFVLIMSYLIFINIFILDIMFFVFLCFLFFVVIKVWKDIDKWQQLLIITSVSFFLLMIKIPGLGLENNFSLYKLFYSILPVKGFRHINRAFMIIFPFLIVFASIGAERFFKKKIHLTPIRKYAIFILILSFLIFENLNNPFAPNSTLKKSKLLESINYDEIIYSKIPIKKNKIILEIPYYFKKRYKNAIYMLNRRFHKNYILNGKVSIRQKEYYRKLSNIIGKRQNNFPSKSIIKKLIQEYSINYIIIHWEMLRKYQRKKQNSNIKKSILKKINDSKRYAKIIFDDNFCTILETQEYLPVTRIIRTFSFYHLKNHSIEVILKKKYHGNISVLLNGEKIKTILSNNNTKHKFFFHKEKLLTSGNKVELIFEEKIEMHSINIL